MISEQERQATPLLSLRGIVKRFGAFTANDDISLDIHQGEAHGLIGEHGAGKSILVKIIYGLLEPTAGVIAFRGQPVRRGQLIGHVGLSGSTTGPHLHWGVRYRGDWLDPARILRAMAASRSRILARISTPKVDSLR